MAGFMMPGLHDQKDVRKAEIRNIIELCIFVLWVVGAKLMIGNWFQQGK